MAFLILALATPAGSALPASGQRSNLLLVTIDTWRGDYLGAVAPSRVATPRLDALAREGMLFTNTRVPAPITLVTHASLLTGLEPPAHGVRNNGTFALSEAHTTLAETLRDAGYQTAAVTGAFVLNGRYGLTQGFETYLDVLPRQATATSPAFPEITATEGTDRAIRLLGRLSPSRPWFLWVHYFDPHAVYAAPERFARRYPQDPYAAEVAYVDEELGRLFAWLESRRLWEATDVIVTSDHGESLGDHGEADHGHLLYEATMRVSTLMKLAGAPRGRRYDTPIRTVDLMPTVLEALGVEAPAEIQGRSVRPVWRGESRRPPPAYGETYLTWYDYGWAWLRSVTLDGWKLIEGPEPELYDLGGDPRETRNRLGDEPERAASLRRVLRGLLRSSARPADSRTRTTAEEAAALRDLGYLGGATPDSPGEDPADLAELPSPRAVLHLQEKIWRAWGEQGRGRTREALELLEQVLEENPTNTSALRFAAALALRLEEWGRAEALFRRLGAAWPSEAWRGDYLAAYRHWTEGRVDEAASRYAALLADCPDVDVAQIDRCLDAMEDLTSLRLAAGDTAGARTALRRHGGFDAASLAIADRIRLAGLRVEAGLTREAELELRRLTAELPDLAEAHLALGGLYRRTGRREEAIAAFERVLELDPQNQEARQRLATLKGRRRGRRRRSGRLDGGDRQPGARGHRRRGPRASQSGERRELVEQSGLYRPFVRDRRPPSRVLPEVVPADMLAATWDQPR